MLQKLQAARLITGTDVIERPILTLDRDGHITAIEPNAAPSGETGILTATFFDIHTHGGSNHDVMEGTPEALAAVNRHHARHGVGHYLPTTVTAPIDTTLAALEGIANAIEAPTAPGSARPVGIHLEGPFISHAKRGVHPPSEILPPDIGLFDRFQQAARGHIKLITIAPEIPGALDLIRHCAAQGVTVSLGHSNAVAAEARAGIAAGARSATHTYNAMRALDHREPGILGVVLDDDSLYAEIICDGIHVVPELIRLWLKAKGPERALLVTDSMSAAGMPDGSYSLGTFPVTVANGRALATEDLANGKETLAGSVLTLNRAVENLLQFTPAPLEVASRLASRNPATLLGLESTVAAVAPGQPANLNLFSPEGRHLRTFLHGAPIE